MQACTSAAPAPRPRSPGCTANRRNSRSFGRATCCSELSGRKKTVAPITSTQALTNATLPYALALADKGAQAALQADAHLLNGLNVCKGHITYAAVAHDLGYAYMDPLEALAR